MLIYVVTMNDQVAGVFSSKEKAESVARKYVSKYFDNENYQDYIFINVRELDKEELDEE